MKLPARHHRRLHRHTGLTHSLLSTFRAAARALGPPRRCRDWLTGWLAQEAGRGVN